MRHKLAKCALIVVASLLVGAKTFLVAQQPNTGTPPLSSISAGPFDNVDLGNLDVNFTIPIFSRPGKGGLGFSYSLAYSSLIWEPSTFNGRRFWAPATQNPDTWGWMQLTDASTGHVYPSTFTSRCSNGGTLYTYSSTQYPLVYVDPNGTAHKFTGTLTYSGNNSTCPDQETLNETAPDGSGLLLNAQASSTGVSATVTTPGGVVLAPSAHTVTDRNGNQLSSTTSGYITQFTDTLDSNGSHVLKVDATNSLAVKYEYPAPNGGIATATVNYSYFYVETNFGLPDGTSNWGPNREPLVTSIVMPDGSQYSFSYESTPSGCQGCVTGRLASVSLPTGGTIDYTYTGTNCSNNSSCMMADGSPAAMQRNYVGQGEWQYTRGYQSGHNYTEQTTTSVTDPNQNVTNLIFSNNYETQRTVYEGSSTILDYSYICYNGNGTDSTCPGATVTTPITWTSRNDHKNQISFTSNYSAVQTYFDCWYNQTTCVGNIVESIDFDYGTRAELADTVISYDSALCSNSHHVCNAPQSVTIKDGSGNAWSYVTYIYDGGANTNGNLTSVSRWASSSGLSLVSNYSYNTGSGQGGTLATAEDPNTTTTTYTYASGVNSCYGAFPTSISVPADGGGSNTTSYSYNCGGGAVTWISDGNAPSQRTEIVYNEPDFWRPSEVVDPVGNTTIFNYYGVNNTGNSSVQYPGQVESLLNLASGSAVDQLSTVDGFGRTFLEQQREGPSSGVWDTAEVVYDAMGRITWSLLPYSINTPGRGTTSSMPATGYTYDALNRYVTVADWSGLNVQYTYSQNDVTVASTSAPAQTRQYEYDVLGRLTSVCEVTGMTTAGCGQNNGANTGYKTAYQYDPLGDLTSVVQDTNQGVHQQRSYAYDSLRRLISETNPESGTTSYTYDYTNGSSCAGPGNASNSPGDLVYMADAASNHVCYYYDGLHRLTDVGSNRQSPSNPCHRFRYDNSTGYKGTIPSGVTPSVTMGRMVEAATDDCSSQSDPLLTDEWFGYNGEGYNLNFWESTPHSNGYKWVTSTFWPNGLLGSLHIGGGITMTYTADPKGRLSSVSASTGQNPVTSTSYNPADQVIQINYGSGDLDQFTYDPDSGRILQTEYNAGGQTVTTSTQWNGNATLSYMSIADPVNPGNQQTCNTYNYDDLGRLTQITCGNVWQQTFSYDPFGNIKKTAGNQMWNPIYDPANNNRYQTGGGISYDPNGNLTSDTFNTYTWDIYGNPSTVNGQSLVFDALDRMVENSTTSREYLYAPGTGSQILAMMNGQTVLQTQYPLPAGGAAIYNTSTLTYARPDWLGSARLLTNTSGNVLADNVYAPFGEKENSSTGNFYSFTGQQQWTTTGLDDFLFRRYHPVQGRWISPDPAGLLAVDISNPQTWNRYAYVTNNPLNNIDPLGLDCVFLNDDGTGIEEVDADTDTSPSSCTNSNGFYVPGVLTGYTTATDGSILSLLYAPFSNTNGVGYDGPQPDFGSSSILLNYVPQWLNPTQIGNLVSQNNNSSAPDSVVNCIVGVESSGNPQTVPLNENHLAAVGQTAKGLMQVNVGAAQDVINAGLSPTVGLSVSQVQAQEFNPAFAIQLGTAYLQLLTNRFGGLNKALSHYGPNEPSCVTTGK